jgi:hypothetical protein
MKRTFSWGPLHTESTAKDLRATPVLGIGSARTHFSAPGRARRMEAHLRLLGGRVAEDLYLSSIKECILAEYPKPVHVLV